MRLSRFFITRPIFAGVIVGEVVMIAGKYWLG